MSGRLCSTDQDRPAVGAGGPGRGELVLQVQDSQGRREGVALVELGAYALGEEELTTAVAAVPTAGAERPGRSGGVQGPQERLLDTEDLGGLAGGVGGVVKIIQQLVEAGTLRPVRRLRGHRHAPLGSVLPVHPAKRPACLTDTYSTNYRKTVSVIGLVAPPQVPGRVIDMTDLRDGPSTREVRAEFAELIFTDDQWLRAEFDALVAAGFGTPPRWPCPPAPPHRPHEAPGHSAPRLTGWSPSWTAAARAGRRRQYRRQRSPPAERKSPPQTCAAVPRDITP
jgi:hypothetical protein